MDDLHSIRARAEETPAGSDAPRSNLSAIPYDLLREASGRLGVLCLLGAVLWTVATIIYHLVLPEMTTRITDTISLVSGGISLGLFAWSRRARQSPRLILDIGLAHMVTTAFALGLLAHWDHMPSGMPLRPAISWVGALMLMFAAIVPTSPVRMFVAGFISASMNPLSMLVAKAQGLWDYGPAGNVLLMHFPDYLLVGVAVVISRVVTRLGRQVGKAREMGSYQLTRMLGKGGMGEVWQARHRMLARDAAIKLIQPELLARGSGNRADQVQRRFEQEAKITASLRSPHTVNLYDYGVTEDGIFYYVMELLDGIDLATLVTRFGPQPPARVAHILRQTCLSLADAHRHQLIHRDIKPNNIFLCRMGGQQDFAKVLDFGLVKPINAKAGGMTAEGGTLGTPDYMAPEQVLGREEIDGRSDLYGLGCVGYWLLTGKQVFEATGTMPMMLAHVRDVPVAPSERCGMAIPGGLERIVLRCLAKEPAERFDSAEILARELETCEGLGKWTAGDADRWWAKYIPEGVEAASLNEGLPTLTQGVTL